MLRKCYNDVYNDIMMIVKNVLITFTNYGVTFSEMSQKSFLQCFTLFDNVEIKL